MGMPTSSERRTSGGAHALSTFHDMVVRSEANPSPRPQSWQTRDPLSVESSEHGGGHSMEQQRDHTTLEMALATASSTAMNWMAGRQDAFRPSAHGGRQRA
eukprot:1806783-Amphidinium_carterae.2